MTNSITGTSDKDTLVASADAEIFDGLGEYDTVDYRPATSGITVDLADLSNNTGFAAGDSYISIERFFLSSFADHFFGSAGNDSANGGDGDDHLHGGDGRDALTGHSGNDWLYGQNGDDGLYGGGNNDHLFGGEGDDGLRGDGGDDNLDGGIGNDRLYGGTGNDVLIGGLGDDTVTGEAGDDTLIYTFGDGVDTLTGDVGNDTLVFALSSAEFNQDIEDDLRNLQAHLDGRLADAGGDSSVLDAESAGALTNFVHLGFSLSTIENVSIDYDGTKSTLQDFLDGLSPKPMTLVDVPGNQVLVGGDADDTIVAHRGRDIYDGGAGFDTLDMSLANRAVVDLKKGTAYGLGRDTVKDIEAVIAGDGNDVLAGSRGDNLLVGGDGHDRLYGRRGDDELEGGAGNDLVHGGYGHDRVDGGDGNDRLYGASGNDTLLDGSGNDNVHAGWGDDVVIAGTGKDIFDGSRGFDTIDFSNADGALEINFGARSVISTDGNDQIVNFESVIGSEFGDTIVGSYRAGEILSGGAGDDTIRSLRGSDTLNGGEGADTFVFETGDVVGGRRHYGADEIEDFSAVDSLDFSSLFRGPVDATQVVNLVEVDGNTMVSAQVGPRNSFVDVAQLNGVTGLTVADMIDDDMLIV